VSAQLYFLIYGVHAICVCHMLKFHDTPVKLRLAI